MALTHIPCAPNDNPGEQITRNFLMNAFAGKEGVLLTNYHLPSGNGTLENDIVLFNRRGIWLIEVKNWRGSIEIDQFKWHRNGVYVEHSPLISVEGKAKALATVLENEAYMNISVMGLVVLAHPDAVLKNSPDSAHKEPREDKVFHLDDRLIRAVTGKHYLYKQTNKELNMKLIWQIVDMLVPRKIDPGREIIGNSYRIQYYLGPGSNEVFHAYKAEHMTIPGRYARAKKYVPDAVSTAELKEAIYRFRRDMQALVKVEHHPNIVQVYDYQIDRDSSDTYWLLLEWVKGITLRERLDVGPAIPWPEQRRILYAMLDALDCCHTHGILHRNLNPSCIYLADDGTIKLGDFDFARVPDLSITLTATGQPLYASANRYMAPELGIDARAADTRSDLYALGAIWYDMAVHTSTQESSEHSQKSGKHSRGSPLHFNVEEISLHPDARDLLARLLAPDPHDRPRSAKAVKRWLEQVQDQDTP
jgi:hypothetical protein